MVKQHCTNVIRWEEGRKKERKGTRMREKTKQNEESRRRKSRKEGRTDKESNVN